MDYICSHCRKPFQSNGVGRYSQGKDSNHYCSKRCGGLYLSARYAKKQYDSSLEFREKKKQLVYEWRKKNPDKYKEATKKYFSLYKEKYIKLRLKKRLKVLRHYSGGTPRCRCCGEDGIPFLTIDHIVPLSGKKRDGGNLCDFLVRNNFPVGFQVLCYNCNLAKGESEDCPHKKLGYSLMCCSATHR